MLLQVDGFSFLKLNNIPLCVCVCVYQLSLFIHLSADISSCLPTLRLSEPSPFWVFIEASLHGHDCLHHWPLMIELNLQLLSRPQRWGVVGLKVPTL